MVKMVRMTVEFRDDEDYETIVSGIARQGVDIVDEETFDSEDDD